MLLLSQQCLWSLPVHLRRMSALPGVDVRLSPFNSSRGKSLQNKGAYERSCGIPPQHPLQHSARPGARAQWLLRLRNPSLVLVHTMQQQRSACAIVLFPRSLSCVDPQETRTAPSATNMPNLQAGTTHTVLVSVVSALPARLAESGAPHRFCNHNHHTTHNRFLETRSPQLFYQATSMGLLQRKRPES